MKKLCCLAIAAVIACSGCGLFQNYETGTAISDAQLAAIQANKTTQQEVLALFGPPSRTMQVGDDQLVIYDHQIIKHFGDNVNESVNFTVNKKGVVTNVSRSQGSNTSNPLLDAAGVK